MSVIRITNSIWKDIIGYEGLYKVSSDGKVYSYKNNKLLKLSKSKRELIVGLYKDGKKKVCSVAKLVAESFVPNPYEYKHIYFIDGNSNNVKASNIQWNYTNRNTKIVVDGMVFNSLKDYKNFCKANCRAQRIMELNDICDIIIPNSKTISPKSKPIVPVFKF